jgi:hypothetical protein
MWLPERAAYIGAAVWTFGLPAFRKVDRLGCEMLVQLEVVDSDCYLCTLFEFVRATAHAAVAAIASSTAASKKGAPGTCHS